MPLIHLRGIGLRGGLLNNGSLLGHRLKHHVRCGRINGVTRPATGPADAPVNRRAYHV
jgi:hypothetical protein